MSEQEINQYVSESYGPIVSRNDSPALYQNLDLVFSRLSEAQRNLIGDGFLSVNELHVVDSPVLNAFVVADKSPGIRRVMNRVYITTGLLKKFYAPSGSDFSSGMKLSAEDLRLGTIRVAGVLAHELAHPIEETDPEAFKKRVGGGSVASQTLEIRADTEGAVIARNAGYPSDSVYQGLSRLFEGKNPQVSSVASMMATHPENNLRLSSQRLFLTMNRYQQGAATAKYPEATKSSFIQELRAINKSEAIWQYSAPKTLSEALQRLIGVPELRRSKEYQAIEFNRLLLAVDQMMITKGTQLSPEERSLYYKFAEAYATRGEYPRVFQKNEFQKFFSKETGSESFALLPDHFELMKQIPFTHEVEYQAWLKKTFPLAAATMHDLPIRKWQALTPFDTLFSSYKTELVNIIKKLSKLDLSVYYFEGYFESESTPEFRLKLANFFYDEVFPQLTQEEKRRMLAVRGANGKSTIFPQYDAKGGATNAGREGIFKDRFRLLSDPRKIELQKLNADLAARFWSEKGYWGCMDLMLDFNNFDWEWVWESLGIDPNIGRSQLRNAVKEYAKTPAYAELVKEAISGRGGGLKIGSSIANGQPIVKLGSPSWFDSTLWPYLAGEYNAQLKADPEALSAARLSFAGLVLRDGKDVAQETFRKVYGEKFRAWMSSLPPSHSFSAEELIAKHQEILAWISGKRAFANNSLEFLQQIESPRIPEAVKKNTLQQYFLGSDLKCLEGSNGQNTLKIIEALKNHGVIQSSLDVLNLKLQRSANEIAIGAINNNYFSTVGILKEEVIAEVEKALAKAGTNEAKKKILLEFSEKYLNPMHGRPYNGVPTAVESYKLFANSNEIRAIKSKVIELAETLHLNEPENIRLFRSLTGTGPTLATDRLFNQSLKSLLHRPLDGPTSKFLREMAEAQRFVASSTQLSVAHKLLDGETASLANTRASAAEVHALVSKINRYVPQGSLAKDDFLESLAWKLHLSGSEFKGLIEDEKSYNWRKANPILVNLGSAIATPLNQMDERNREQFIEYLLNPEGKELPDYLFKDIESNAYSQLVSAGDAKAKEKSQEIALSFKYKVEAMLQDSSPMERIPLLEMMLSAGDNALAKQADYPSNISRKYLGYAANSLEEKMLSSFLKVIPETERSVTLAYLLSQVGQNKSSINSLFEVFQTVGIKFGQMSSVWKIFGDDVAKQTASLKDNAAPMSKAEIEDVLEETLAPEEWKKIKSINRVLGSASLKTVAEVELNNGKKVVVALQRPFAKQQIESNLNLSLQFLEELKKENVNIPTGMFDALVQDLREQLSDETKMTEEAKKIQEAKLHYEKMNSVLRDSLQAYRFEVPGLAEGFQVRDAVLFQERAGGVTWNKLDQATRNVVGDAITESSLRLFFRDGWFDPDRHAGNVLVDTERKIIHPIDFGQAEQFSKLAPWKEDERFIFAQFLRAIAEENPGALAEYGAKMAEQGTVKSEDIPALREKMEKILLETKGKNISDRIVGIVNGLAEGGVKLQKKFSFGALKGLMLLQGEQYVSSDRFAAILKQEIVHITGNKLPLASKSACDSLYRSLGKFLRR